MKFVSTTAIGCTALGATLLVTAPAQGVTLTESFDGGVFNTQTPTTNTDDDGAPTLVLENDALTASIVSSGRGTILFDTPSDPAGPGDVVTQSVDFTVPGTNAGGDPFLFNVSRLGFIFGVTDPATSTLGPSDAVYAYMSEPSGDFAAPEFDVTAFDSVDGFLAGNDPATAGFSPLSGDTLYTMTSTATYLANGDIDVDFTVTGGGVNIAYSTSLDVPDGGGTVEGGTYNGIYFRNFNDDAEIIFDNYSLSIVPEPTSLALIGTGALILAARRRRVA
ncbi:MAG: PEP-CTERM sorting domain-containing protein [Planctomycetota bacterium]